MATRRGIPRGFTLIEILCAVLILGITATIAIDAVANTDASLRAERAARETVAALRFARSRAMADGVKYIVRFNVAGKTISVVDPNNAYSVLAAPMPGSQMLLNLASNAEIANVAMTPAITGAATDPYDITYTPNGGTVNNGTITFTYGVSTKVLQVPNVGDPILVGDTRRP